MTNQEWDNSKLEPGDYIIADNGEYREIIEVDCQGVSTIYGYYFFETIEKTASRHEVI